MPSVFGRVAGEMLVLDMRTVGADEVEALAGRVRSALEDAL